jgi:hypothetical protein
MDKVEFIALVRHLCWCCYQLGAGQAYNPEPTEEQLESLKDGVRFLLDNPGATAEENHTNWMKKKLEQGWVYGESKDPEKRTHPDLVPYNQLPQVEQLKDIMTDIAHKKALELWHEVKELYERIYLRINTSDSEKN